MSGEEVEDELNSEGDNGDEDLVLWRKIRKMRRRTGRSETRSGGLTQFIVCKD